VFIDWAVGYLVNSKGLFKENSTRSKAYYSITKYNISIYRRSAVASLLRSWVRIPPGAWIFVCCECCVLSGRGLCD
jgi:hypothetical protein